MLILNRFKLHTTKYLKKDMTNFLILDEGRLNGKISTYDIPVNEQIIGQQCIERRG